MRSHLAANLPRATVSRVLHGECHIKVHVLKRLVGVLELDIGEVVKAASENS